MSLQLTLNNALSGLNVNKQALTVLSQNIANANNPDYSRKIITQEAQYIDGNGVGVRISDISRQVDQYLQQSIQMQQGDVGKTAVISDFMDRIQVLIGKPGAANSMDSYITNFFNSMQTLAERPDLSSARLDAVNNGDQLARTISSLASSLQSLRLSADQSVNETVQNINNKLKELFNVNQSLSAAYNTGRSQAELLDKRDTLLRDIGKNIDINMFYRNDGTVQVYAGSGQTLLDSTLYQLSYTSAPTQTTFITDASLSPIYVYRTQDGKNVGEPATLMPGGPSSQLVPTITTGKIRGLMDLRDQVLPAMVEQLDMLASRLRDQLNAIHNAGTGYPGAASLTGTRAFDPTDYAQWNGSVRIALTDNLGNPLPSPYSGESGLRPLTLDLSTLDTGTGNGAGQPSMQTIIDEINRYYATPQNKASVGNINNIRLASDSLSIPGTPPSFVFDFDLENTSAANADFFVSDIHVMNDANVDITSVTSTVPKVNLATTNTFVTTAASSVVTVNTAGAANGLLEGQRVFISDPGAAVNGIPRSALNQFFTITNVTPTSFQIVIPNNVVATSGGGVNLAGMTANPKYTTVEPGEQARTNTDGKFTADLTGNTTSSFYTIVATIGVDDGNGGVKTATISYKVANNQSELFNTRYSASTLTGEGTLVRPNINTPYARATMVDADGKELPKDANGKYYQGGQGYLKLATTNTDTYLAIDSLNSQQLGKPLQVPPVDGTDRGFSYFFELNNFFTSNAPTTTGDTVQNSAMNLAVESRLLRNPSLVSTGVLTAVASPADPSLPPPYTYARAIGDNSIIQRLANLKSAQVQFDTAGGITGTTETLGQYSSEILAVTAAAATGAATNKNGAQTLLDGFTQRANAVSGVNLDEELANTVIYQNAYAASARIISVTNDLFDSLLKAF